MEVENKEGRMTLSRRLTRRMVRARASISSFVALRPAEDASPHGNDSIGDHDFIPSRSSSLFKRAGSQSPRKPYEALNWTVHGDRYPLIPKDHPEKNDASPEKHHVYRSSSILHVTTFGRGRHKRDPSMGHDNFERRPDIPRSSPIPIRAATVPRLAPLMDVEINTKSLESMISEESDRLFPSLPSVQGSSLEKIFGSLELDEKPPSYERHRFTGGPRHLNEKRKIQEPALIIPPRRPHTNCLFDEMKPRFEMLPTTFREDSSRCRAVETDTPAKLEVSTVGQPLRPCPHLSLDAATDQIFHDLEVDARELLEKVTETVEHQAEHDDDLDAEGANNDEQKDVQQRTEMLSKVSSTSKSDKLNPSPIEGVNIFHPSGEGSPVFVSATPLDPAGSPTQSVESAKLNVIDLADGDGLRSVDSSDVDPDYLLKDEEIVPKRHVSEMASHDGSQDDRSTLHTLRMSKSDEELMQELHRCLKHNERDDPSSAASPASSGSIADSEDGDSEKNSGQKVRPWYEALFGLNSDSNRRRHEARTDADDYSAASCTEEWGRGHPNHNYGSDSEDSIQSNLYGDIDRFVIPNNACHGTECGTVAQMRSGFKETGVFDIASKRH